MIKPRLRTTYHYKKFQISQSRFTLLGDMVSPNVKLEHREIEYLSRLYHMRWRDCGKLPNTWFNLWHQELWTPGSCHQCVVSSLHFFYFLSPSHYFLFIFKLFHLHEAHLNIYANPQWPWKFLLWWWRPTDGKYRRRWWHLTTNINHNHSFDNHLTHSTISFSSFSTTISPKICEVLDRPPIIHQYSRRKKKEKETTWNACAKCHIHIFSKCVYLWLYAPITPSLSHL